MAHERRIFINGPIGVGTELAPSAEDTRHLRSVLRAEEGMPVIVVSADTGTEYRAVVSKTKPDLLLKILDSKVTATSSSKVSSLLFSLCRAPVNDLVVEKAAELGVRDIILFKAERSVSVPERGELASKVSRWKKLAEGAAKQSQKGFLMNVHIALSATEALEQLSSLRKESDLGLICSLSPLAKSVQRLYPIKNIAHIAIGPAGDFTDAEEEEFTAKGFERISLGSNLLRAETAAIAAISMVQAISMVE